MLLRVATRRSMYNNSGVASSLLGALIKMVYYYIFACFYGMAGGCANVSSYPPLAVKQNERISHPLSIYTLPS